MNLFYMCAISDMTDSARSNFSLFSFTYYCPKIDKVYSKVGNKKRQNGAELR